MFPKGYDDQFFRYMTITTVLKAHGKIDLWKEWSKENVDKYDPQKNSRVWNGCKPIYNINLLVYILRTDFKKDVKYIGKYKKYEPITSNTFYNNVKHENNEYVSNIWDYQDFLNHDVHIIKSTTGTGKTTATSANMERYMNDNKDMKFLSLTSRTTLSDQHKVSFKNIGL